MPLQRIQSEIERLHAELDFLKARIEEVEWKIKEQREALAQVQAAHDREEDGRVKQFPDPISGSI